MFYCNLRITATPLCLSCCSCHIPAVHCSYQVKIHILQRSRCGCNLSAVILLLPCRIGHIATVKIQLSLTAVTLSLLHWDSRITAVSPKLSHRNCHIAAANNSQLLSCHVSVVVRRILLPFKNCSTDRANVLTLFVNHNLLFCSIS